MEQDFISVKLQKTF